MNWKAFIRWFTVIGSIASILGALYIFYPRDDSKIRLEFILSSCDNLTVFNTTGDSEITAFFEYRGEKIDNLWNLNISLVNNSSRTIIGYGQSKNIMFNNLTFFVKNDFRIIAKRPIHSDFKHCLSIVGNDTIVLSFKQWRVRERLEYSFYVTADSENTPDIDIFSQPKERQIIDGDIFFLRKVENRETEKTFITNALGIPTKRAIYVIYILMCFVFLFVLVWITISTPVSYVKRYTWKKKHLEKYNQFIRETYIENKRMLDAYINNPQAFRNWSECGIPAYVDSWGLDLEMNRAISVIATSFTFAVLSFIQLVLIVDVLQLLLW